MNSTNIQLALDNVDQGHSSLDFRSQQRSMSSLRNLLSSKKMALAALSVNLNCLVAGPVFAVFKILDGILLLYTLAVIIQSQVGSQAVKDTWLVEAYLYELPEMDLIVIQSCMLLLQLTLVFLWLMCCHSKDSLQNLKQDSSFIPGLISLLQGALWTFLSVPYLHIIIRTFFIDLDKGTLPIFIGNQCLNALNLLFFIFIQIFLRKIATLKVPLQRAPHGQIDHRSVIIRLMLKVCYVLIVALLSRLDYIASYLNILSIILLILTLGACLFRLCVVPLFNRTVNIIVNLTNWMCLVCCFIILINTFDNKVDQMNLYYLAILSPFLLSTSFLVEYHWQHRILSKIRDGQSKMEMQFTYLLYLLQEQVHNLKGSKSQMSDSLKFLFGILEDHNGECLKGSCLCHHAESLVWILNQKHDENQQIIELTGEDIDFLNAISLEPLYQKDQYTQAPFTFNDFQDRKAVVIKSSIKQQLQQQNTNIGVQDEFESQQSVDFAYEDEKGGPVDQQNLNDHTIFKIDSHKLKQAFFATFLRQYFEQGTLKFPGSLEMKIQYAHFALIQLRNVYLCLNILKQIDPTKLSYFERCTFLLQENFLLYEIQNTVGKADVHKIGFEQGLLGVINIEKVKYNSSLDHSQLDSEAFLDYAKLQELFNSTTQALSKHILQFWVLLYEQVLQVDKLLREGALVANYIAQTYDTFRLMDEASKHKNERIFYNFAIIHQQLLNDSQTYYLYIQKMKHIINMKKFIKKNYQMTDSYQDSGLLLVSGNFQSFGKIMQSNKVFQGVTGYTVQDLKYSSYELIMNDMVKKMHGAFVAEFNRSGTNVILDKKLNQFIKKKNGYIIPVHLIVKTHFSKYHGYTFIAFINPIKEVQLDGSLSLGVPVEKLLFLLCDNYDGKIYNISKSCSSKLGLRSDQILKNQSSLDLEIKVGALSPALDIAKIRDLQGKYGSSSGGEGVYQGLIKLDLNALNQKSNARFNASHLVDARFKLIMESYSLGKLEMNIVIIQTFDQEKDGSNPYLTGTVGVQQKPQNPESSLLLDQTLKEQEQIDQDKAFEDVASSSSSDSSKPNDQIKSQSISMEKKIPRNLKIVTQMLFIMFCTMTAVSTINLYLSKSRSQKLYEEIDVVRKSFDRINYAARSRLMIRNLLNMANGLEPNSTYILQNRSKSFHEELFSAQEQLRLVQNFLDGTKSLFSDELQQRVSQENLELVYMDDEGQVYTKKHTMSYVINIYVSKLLEVYNFPPSKLMGRLPIQTLTPPKSKTPFKPTNAETAIFFTVVNGNNVIQDFSMRYADYYTQDIKNYSEDSITQTKITILISISTIVLVFAIVTPLLSMIQDRQYTSIGFFLPISKVNIQKLIDQTKTCYDSLYRLDFTYLMDKNEPHDDQEEEESDALQEESQYPDNSMTSMMGLTNNTQQNFTRPEQTQGDNDGLIAGGPPQPVNSQNKANGPNQNQSSQNVNNKQNLNRIIFQSRRQDDYSDSSYSSSDVNFEASSNPADPKTIVATKKVTSDEEKKKQHELEAEAEIYRTRLHEVLTKKKQRRCRVIALAFVFMIMFSLYFVGSYFMSYNTYSIVPQMIEDLNVIYFKDSCLENLIIYSKENLIQNKSYPLYMDPQNRTASTFFIERCLEIEKAYTNLRKGSGSQTLAGVSDYIAAVETEGLCETVFQVDKTQQKLCSTAQNGMLQKGLTNAISIIISNFNQINLRFLGSRNRTAAELKAMNLENDNLILIELKVFVMDELFKQLKNKATDSSSQFLSSQTNQYVIFFSAFILILVTLIILVFGVMFRKLRDYLWKINLTMKILPLEYLDREKIQDLKDFFKT